jgi:hypothetical protein
MGTARSSHTATLLKDGRVLVTGGVDSTRGYFATAEIFDPTSGTFAPTGSMGTARSSHTATLLKDGRVLLTGGVDIATAELFDPASGSFAPTGSMGTWRYSHTATLLNDGKVLVTGGAVGGTVLATAEIFDPARGTFAPTGSMGSVRCLHTATLLKDGKVLVTGGLENFFRMPALSAAELFDPTSGTFGATADMTAARYSHTATLLTNGKVLVTGGVGSVVAGFSTALATAELDSPDESVWICQCIKNAILGKHHEKSSVTPNRNLQFVLSQRVRHLFDFSAASRPGLQHCRLSFFRFHSGRRY